MAQQGVGGGSRGLFELSFSHRQRPHTSAPTVWPLANGNRSSYPIWPGCVSQ